MPARILSPLARGAKSQQQVASRRVSSSVVSERLVLGIAGLVGAASLACACQRSLAPEAPRAQPERARVVPVIVEKSSLRPLVDARRQDVVDVLHGVPVADPYRWLESSDDPEVRAWVDAQNALLERTLARLPQRQTIRQRLSELMQIGHVSLPSVRKAANGTLRYFYSRRDADQDQPVLRVRDRVDGSDRVLLDPNAMSADKTTSLDWFVPAWDGSLVAYGTSEGGSEESTLRIRDVASGQDLPDSISRARYSSVCWLPGAKRFYYARFPAPGSVPAGEEKYHRKIYEHALGRDPDLDPLVFGQGQPMTDFPSCTISPNGRWLVIRVHQGWSKSSLWLGDTSASRLELVELTRGLEQIYDPLALDDVIYVRSNEAAPRYALWAVDPKKPQRDAWRRVIAEHSTDVLGGFDAIGGQLFVSYLARAVSRIERFDTSGKSLGAIELPTLGSNDGFSGLHDGREVFFDFESFAVPPSVRRLELTTGKLEVWQQVNAPINADDFVVTQGKASSKDGTQVPYLMVHSKQVDLKSGRNPTLLYGYGGFNVSLQPRFSRTNFLFLERGGVCVQANLRGGGEFGEDWHRAGQLDKKQNVFDDFIAVSEGLISGAVTSPERLAIHGRSNGGLLVAAALTQRPDLYRAAVSGVPLTDMLRYQHFLIAKLWIPEYGSAEDPEQFKWLHAYSPYHRVRPGTAYPALLLTTAVSDTRVDPMHARKLAAAVQHATASSRPVLLRTELQAGHGAGKPIHKVVEEYADVFAFLLWQLEMIGES
jgi:prolyl oligopeptidase